MKKLYLISLLLVTISSAFAVSPVILDSYPIDNQINSREAATFEVSIINNRNEPSEFLMSAPLSKWDATFSDYTVKVGPKTTKTINLRLAPPMDSNEGKYAIFIKATDIKNIDNYAYNYAQVDIIEKIRDEKREVTISESVNKSILIHNYKFNIENTGNVEYIDSYTDYLSELEYFLFSSSNVYSVEEYGKDKKIIFEYGLSPGERIDINYSINYTKIYLIIALILSGFGGFLYYYLTRFKLEKSLSKNKDTFSIKLKLTNKSKVEQNNVIVEDFIPMPLALIKNFGTAIPDQIISKRKGTRLVWKFDSLAPKEERLLSYEIKSKIHVIGKLNIPQASLVQTKSGKKISKIFSGKLNLTGK